MSGWNVIWTVLLVLLALFMLLLVIPVYLRITFRGELTIRIRIGGIPFRLYPRREKSVREEISKAKKTERRSKAESGKKLSTLSKMLKEDGVRAVISYYTSLAQLLTAEAKRFFRAVTVDHLRIHLIVASGDAAETAQNYGRACAVVFPAEALLESGMRIRHRSVRLEPDFLASKGRAELDIRLHAVPIRLLWTLLRSFISFLFHQNISSKPHYKEASSHG